MDTDLSDYGAFNLGTIEQGLPRNSYIPMTVTGYPGEQRTDTSGYQLYSARGYLIYSDEYILRCESDANDGESGGPAYVSIEYQIGNQTPYIENIVVGIFVGDTPVDSNCDGVIDFADTYQSTVCRITAPMLQFFLNNPNVPDLS